MRLSKYDWLNDALLEDNESGRVNIFMSFRIRSNDELIQALDDLDVTKIQRRTLICLAMAAATAGAPLEDARNRFCVRVLDHIPKDSSSSILAVFRQYKGHKRICGS
jgi:hypothetical protein